ncbi:heme oxygenase-domain-containing protein [Halteromyces radiatus]|uniref:heme oxygenase-domain-containing protein n=1 Tax=Halteromyces radiatus TaxID=101107 RepID=UPI00221F1F43|nr:heme oxygenase-domain-containing protein [Halteromyces radiatus]KAI8093687.1 heme oxygenase-domain-containing protein [Halteromyces radiatus]
MSQELPVNPQYTTLPHPGLEDVDIDGLKHKCPAFATGCPYAKIDEVDSLAVSFGELSKCPAFQKGCPFSNKSKEEISTLLATIPKEHPTLNMNELPSCEEGIALVKILNQFLTVSQLDSLFNEKKSDIQEEILEDPQLAQKMREGTKVVHRAAETSVFTRRFLKGDITREEYGRYILSLYFVYQKMEALLQQHKDHPAVKLIHFPTELNREQALLQDLEFFYGKEGAIKQVTDTKNVTPAVKSYVDAMEQACAKEPALLIAHSYSRYLGDLSGGQILAKRLKTAILGLKPTDVAWDTKDGLAFYHFEQLGNQAEFKDFYRQRLNGAHVNATTRDMIVSEAVRSFELNIAVFDEIQHLSESNQLPPMDNKSSFTKTTVEKDQDGNTITTTYTTTTTTTYTDGSSPSEKHRQRRQQRRRPTPADSNITCWIMGTTLAITAISVGLHVYKRYYLKEK